MRLRMSRVIALCPQERQEAERLRKQEAADRERRRRQQQEEARQRREEEARQRREEEARQRREEEEEQEQRRRVARQAQDSQRYQDPPDPYDDDVQPTTHPSSSYRGGASQQATPRPQADTPASPSTAAPTPRKPAPQRRLPPPQRRRPPTPLADEEEAEDLPAVPGPGNEIYSQAVEGERGVKVKLAPCKLCGRKFAEDRLAKHQTACKTAHKKRKVMDASQMRTGGTEMAQYVSKGAHKKEPPVS